MTRARSTPRHRLGAPRIAERFADLTREVPGLDAGQVHIREGSPFVDRPLGDTRARTRTGASIVAIVRDDEVLASPGPAEPLRAGDVLVYQNGGVGHTPRESIATGMDLIDEWKLFAGYAAPGTGNKDTYPHRIISTPFIGAMPVAWGTSS